MKSKFSLTAILGASALTAGVLFAMPAVSCPLQQVKDFSLTKVLDQIKVNPLQIGMLGIGGTAAVASAGFLVSKKLKETTESTVAVSEDLLS